MQNLKSENPRISLTLWIPTYNRPYELEALLRQIQELQLWKCIEIQVSDNASTSWTPGAIDRYLLQGIKLEKRTCNISGGANFLRAFECATTEWIHIMGDDDELSSDYLDIVKRHTDACDSSIAAIKFDTSLYGRLQQGVYSDLWAAGSAIPKSEVNDWFNNLLLVSGWLFRREVLSPYIHQAYLGYGTKLSHLLPALASCDRDHKRILFSADQPIRFRENQQSWPRAASWVEMCLNTQLGYGYLSTQNRRAFHKCLFGGSASKLFAKVLRIRRFYGDDITDIHWLRVLAIVSALSVRFFAISLISMPFLVLPTRLWPKRLRRALGDEGSTDRW